ARRTRAFHSPVVPPASHSAPRTRGVEASADVLPERLEETATAERNVQANVERIAVEARVQVDQAAAGVPSIPGAARPLRLRGEFAEERDTDIRAHHLQLPEERHR